MYPDITDLNNNEIDDFQELFLNLLLDIKDGLGNQPTILLTKCFHEAAHRAERAWMKKTFGKVRGKWKAMTARQMLELSEIMFDAAKVPKHKRREFYRKFNRYIYAKC